MKSMFAILNQRRLRWLGHVCRMEDGRIPKDILYGELATGTRPTGRPALRYKDACKRILKACGVNPVDLECLSTDRSGWRSTVKAGTLLAEKKREHQCEERRTRRRQRLQSASVAPTNEFICDKCRRSCKSRIGLFSHSRRCNSNLE